MTISGNAIVDVSAPPLQHLPGMTMFSDRKNTSIMIFGGNGDTRFVDSVYALAGTVLLSGKNGSNSSLNSRLKPTRWRLRRQPGGY